MAEYYTVALNDSTGVEITGGRVGHFCLFMAGDSFYLGESGVDATDGVAHAGSAKHTLYVTSPDQIYAVLANDPTGTLKVFHNR